MDDGAAVGRLRTLLPLDDETLGQILESASQLPTTDDVIRHFTGLLGDSPEAFDFISDFNSRLNKGVDAGHESNAINQEHSQSTVPVPNLDPRHVYMKKKEPDSYFPGRLGSTTPKQTKSKEGSNKLNSISLDIGPSKTQAKGTLPGARNYQPSKAKIEGLDEIDAALKQIELASETDPSRPRKKCDCQASIHPLNIVAPNCLNCGKIICVVEGVGPCTFCSKPVLNREQQLALMKSLRDEKSQLKQAHQNRSGKAKTPQMRSTYSTKSGGSRRMVDDNQMQKELDEAESRKQTLLGYDRTSAQRTSVIDQASDFDQFQMVNKWASPEEKALQMLRQQREVRKATKKKNRVMAIDLKGKAVSMHDAESSEEDDDPTIRKQKQAVNAQKSKQKERSDQEQHKDDETHLAHSKLSKLSKPQYVQSGLLKLPLAADHNAVGTRGWRRVQDDYGIDSLE